MNRTVRTSALSAAALASIALGTPAAAQEPRPSTDSITLSQNGSRPAVAGSPDIFTGQVTVEPLFAHTDYTRAGAGHVTFAPGARTAWHTHPAGQTLIVIAGTGWVQNWDGPKREIRPGDVVTIPAGLKHWHGATSTNQMTHIAVQETVDGTNVDWLEHVTDDTYLS